MEEEHEDMAAIATVVNSVAIDEHARTTLATFFISDSD